MDNKQERVDILLQNISQSMLYFKYLQPHCGAMAERDNLRLHTGNNAISSKQTFSSNGAGD